MTRTTALAILLRAIGITSLFAVVAVLMPMSWMASTHRWLGLGEMPIAPIVENLARSVSAFYALFGGLCLVLASDPQRYRPVVRFLGVAAALFGIVLIGADSSAGMPFWWLVADGLSALAIGASMFFMARAEP
jgi:hypothetical protein